MRQLCILIKRNVKLFFKDKGLFFTSLITPCILLVLYATFLSGIYEDSFTASIPQPMLSIIPEKLINGCVGGQLISSLLAVSTVTVAFCSNMLMVQDKVSGARKDITISPVNPHILSLSYYFASLLSTLIICYTATALSLCYVAAVGWYMSLGDCLLLLLDVFLLVMLGTALSSLINFFLSTQGQISAVGSVVSSCYGFICGAYMPISSFGEGLQKVLGFFPGTYATSLLRNHAMRGVFAEMDSLGLPVEAVDSIRDGIDCNIYFLGDRVGVGSMYLVVGLTVATVLGAYVAVNYLMGKKRSRA